MSSCPFYPLIDKRSIQENNRTMTNEKPVMSRHAGEFNLDYAIKFPSKIYWIVDKKEVDVNDTVSGIADKTNPFAGLPSLEEDGYLMAGWDE